MKTNTRSETGRTTSRTRALCATESGGDANADARVTQTQLRRTHTSILKWLEDHQLGYYHLLCTWNLDCDFLVSGPLAPNSAHRVKRLQLQVLRDFLATCYPDSTAGIIHIAKDWATQLRYLKILTPNRAKEFAATMSEVINFACIDDPGHTKELSASREGLARAKTNINRRLHKRTQKCVTILHFPSIRKAARSSRVRMAWQKITQSVSACRRHRTVKLICYRRRPARSGRRRPTFSLDSFWSRWSLTGHDILLQSIHHNHTHVNTQGPWGLQTASGHSGDDAGGSIRQERRKHSIGYRRDPPIPRI